MRQFIFCLFVLVFASFGFGASYKTDHFVIESPLDRRLVSFVELNVEAYYSNMVGSYFGEGWDKPLKIVYLAKQSDTQRLLGNGQKIHYGVYMPSKDTVYTHRMMDNGSLSGWGTLFHEITHHFVATNFEDVPTWFNEGLTSLLSEQSRVAGGKLCVGYPNPWREAALGEMIAGGYKVDVKKIVGMSNEAFYAERNNYHPARALFYLLFEKDLLGEYIEAVVKDGYGLEVLERVCGAKCDAINTALMEFIEQHCYAGALLHEAGSTKDPEAKKTLVLGALELKPGYKAAEMEAARCLMREKDYEGSVAMMAGILGDSSCKEYKDALNLRGVICYMQKEFEEAAQWYSAASERSVYSEYGYQNSFWIANCYHFLEDRENAVEWYEHFLANNWEPGRSREWVDYSKGYVEKYGGE